MPDSAPITTSGIKKSPTVNGNNAANQKQKASSSQTKPPTLKPVNLGTTDHKELKKKTHKSYLTCGLLMVFFLLFTGFVVLFLLAKTGLVKVPYLSKYYDPPSPTRIVTAMPINWDDFEDGLTKKVMAQGGVDESGNYSFLISEEELTGLLRGSADMGLRSDDFNINDSQIAVTPQGLEMFFNITWGTAINLDFLIKAKPVITDKGLLEFESMQARVGDLPLPSFLMMQVVGMVFSRDLGSWDVRVNDTTGIKEILLFDKQMRVKLGTI